MTACEEGTVSCIESEDLTGVLSMKRYIWSVVVVSLLMCGSLEAKNCTVEGDMRSTISFEILKRVSTEPGVGTVTLSFVEPPSFASPTCRQDIRDYAVRFTPEPQERSREVDERGNRVVTATWTEVPPVIDARITFHVSNVTALGTIDTVAPFPMDRVPGDLTPYVKATGFVQSDSAALIQRARELTDGAVSEFDAVQKILSWIVDRRNMTRSIRPKRAGETVRTIPILPPP